MKQGYGGPVTTAVRYTSETEYSPSHKVCNQVGHKIHAAKLGIHFLKRSIQKCLELDHRFVLSEFNPIEVELDHVCDAWLLIVILFEANNLMIYQLTE